MLLVSSRIEKARQFFEHSFGPAFQNVAAARDREFMDFDFIFVFAFDLVKFCLKIFYFAKGFGLRFAQLDFFRLGQWILDLDFLTTEPMHLMAVNVFRRIDTVTCSYEHLLFTSLGMWG